VSQRAERADRDRVTRHSAENTGTIGTVRLPITIAFVATATAGYLFAAWIMTAQSKPWEDTCAAMTWFLDKHYYDPVFAESYGHDFKIVLSHCPP
jgi:hypothetical protein